MSEEAENMFKAIDRILGHWGETLDRMEGAL